MNLVWTDLGEWFLKHLRSEVETSKVFQMSECFDTYAQDAGLLVLLDGLDEVPSTHYPRIQRAIQALSDKLHQMGESNTLRIDTLNRKALANQR
jgi:hypothetical protein